MAHRVTYTTFDDHTEASCECGYWASAVDEDVLKAAVARHSRAEAKERPAPPVTSLTDRYREALESAET